jgi:hypothetical protein
MRHLIVLLIIISIPTGVFSQLLINEFSSSNMTGIRDEDGDSCDWIEIYNHSGSDINLEGYHLSDDARFLSKWTFPALILQPDSFQLVFASGKNRSIPPLHYQTLIKKGDSWKYLVPTSEISVSWRNQGFDASSWNTGNSGFGYGDNDDATVLNNITSVFIRKEFTITNLQDVADLILSIDFDDGFVAYINGKEIVRANLGAAGTFVPFNKNTGTVVREATMYQGKYPESYRIAKPDSFLVQGLNVIAIQGHNAATFSDFSLIPMLTLGYRGVGYADSYPAYIQVKSPGLHTNFKISSDGETLILSNPDSTLADSVAPVKLLKDISYGRKPDGGNSWFYFSATTPGKANSIQGYDKQSGDTVKFSTKGGYFPGEFLLGLYSTDPYDTIVYTFDGSEPTRGSLVFRGPILIMKNTVVRAKTLNAQQLPGVVSTSTYYSTKHTLPVVCVSTDPANLWDTNTGIYVMGPYAETASPYFGANFWQDWERNAGMEFYDADGVKQIDQEIGIKIAGSYSRANSQKSMALYARSEYGKGSFDYQFFKDKPISKFEALLLRNGGNDWGGAIFRDGLTSTIIRDMDVDRMAFQPAIVYINGQYWGILNLREKVNSNFLAENHFINPDKVNILEGAGSVVEGSNVAYSQLLTYLNTNSLETEQNYLQASSKIDINNYIQYQLTQIYVNNHDWPGNNIKWWNTNDPGSLWRWIIYDTDFGFSIWESTGYQSNTLSFALDPAFPDGWPNPPWSTLLFRRMMSNTNFRNNFINQYADRLNTNFTYKKVNSAIDSIRQLYLPEIKDHMSRWGLDYNNWENNIKTLKTYASNRQWFARIHLQTTLNIGTTLSVDIATSSPGSGYVKLNSIIPDIYPFSGLYFKDIPIKLTAIPAPGYKFSRWEGAVNSTSASIDYNMSASASFTAVFEVAGSADLKIVINEINYNSSPTKDTKDWVELYNAGSTAVNLKNWVVSDGLPATGFVFTSDLILAPGMYVVVCRDNAAFRLIRPEVLNSTGDLNFGLSSQGDDINLFNPQGVLVDWVNYTSNFPWPPDANGTGASIELANPMADNNMGSNWNSSSNGGTPGKVNKYSYPLEIKAESIASAFTLSSFPNPFNDYTTIRIEAPAGDYKLEVYDIQGKLLNILADQRIEAGGYYIDWEGKDSNNRMLPGGVYIIRLSGEKDYLNLKVVKL